MDTTICCPNGHLLPTPAPGSAPASQCPVCGAALKMTSGVARPSPNEATEVLAPVAVPPAASKTHGPSGADTQILDPVRSSSAGSPPTLSAPPDAKTEEIRPNQPAPPAGGDAEEGGDAAAEPPLEPQYGFAGVYYGLIWHYFKVADLLLTMIVVAVALALYLYRQTNPPTWVASLVEIAQVVARIALVLLVAAVPVLGLVGSFRCLSVPREARNSRQMIWGAMLLEVLTAALLLVAIAVSLADADAWVREHLGAFASRLLGYAPLLALLAGLGAISFFLLFAEQLCRYFRDRASATEAFALLGRTWAVTAGWVIVGTLIGLYVWLGENRHRYDPSIAIGVGLFVLITLPLALWASIGLLRGMLDLVGSLRHLIWIRTT